MEMCTILVDLNKKTWRFCGGFAIEAKIGTWYNTHVDR